MLEARASGDASLRLLTVDFVQHDKQGGCYLKQPRVAYLLLIRQCHPERNEVQRNEGKDLSFMELRLKSCTICSNSH